MSYLIALALIALVIAWQVYRYRKIRRVIHDWTTRNRLEVVYQYQTWFRLGSMLFGGGKYALRYLRVRDQLGVERNVWLRIGDRFLGVIDDTVEPIWERPAAPNATLQPARTASSFRPALYFHRVRFGPGSLGPLAC